MTSRIGRIQIFTLAILLGFACASTADDDLFAYLKDHGSVVSGTMIVGSERDEFVSVRFTDLWEVAPKWTLHARVGFFGRARSTQSADAVQIPDSAAALASYSDGEAWVSIVRSVAPNVSLEVSTGVLWKMVSLSMTQVGDPLDGTQAALLGGVRFTRGQGHLSVLVGHYGPVIDPASSVGPNQSLAGPIPSLVLTGEIGLPFGSGWAFVPDIAFGSAPPAVAGGLRTLTKSIRLGVSKHF